MGMIIRVAFNNQNWAGKCKNAHGVLFSKCWDGTLDVSYALDKNGNCIANCWESTLCTKYFWENQRGNFSERAEGTVFFVFSPPIDNSLILWGKSEVDRVKNNKVYFREFKPIPYGKWVRDLWPKDILGKPWGSGTYRYLTEEQERFLNNLIK
ncbi:MAG TPA: hypothetical protein VGA82_05640 [Dehalococcoidales bacterium]